MNIENILSGLVQGIAEWLPISSEGALSLLQLHFFSHEGSLVSMVGFALYLHLGTALAAIVYLRKDIWRILSVLWNYNGAEESARKTFWFLFTSTLVSGIFGLLLLKMMVHFEEYLDVGTRGMTMGIGLMLLVTGGLQLNASKPRARGRQDLKVFDGVLLGLMQGLAALPGLSRSGLTVSALLLCGHEEEDALRLSFLMSIPIVVAGNIAMDFGMLTAPTSAWQGMLVAFASGLGTIHVLLSLARKIPWGWFCLGFGALVLATAWL